MKILIVEDDRAVAESLQLLFSTYHYAADLAADSATGLAMTEVFDYDLILLDVRLPDGDGVDLCQQLRKTGLQCPILLLTGQGSSQTKATALNGGADDYVTKPFDPSELMARVQALLRRGELNHTSTLTFDGLSMDPSSHRVAYGDRLLTLSPKTYAILELLLRNPEKSFTSAAILSHVWTSLEMPGEETVRVHIKDLRQKLTALGAPKDLIKTQHRQGYRLNPLYATPVNSVMFDRLTPPQIAELNATNATLRSTMAELRSTQAELEQKNQELQAARDQLEQRVADRTAALQILYDQAPCGYHSLDAAGRIVQINATELRMFGYEREEMIGRKITDFYTPEGLQTFQENYPKFIQQGWVNDLEFTIVRKDGSRLPISLSATAVKDEAGNFLLSRSIIVDMSERVRIEADRQQTEVALQASETKYRSLFNSVDEGFHIIELIADAAGEVVDYRFLESNPAFERLTGLTNTAGKLGSEIAPQTESYWLEAYVQVARTGEPLRIENYNEDTRSWYAASVSRVGGAGSWQVAIVFDEITDRKRREANAAFLAEMTEAFSRLSTADEIMRAVGEKVGTYLKISNCLLAEIDEGQDQAIIEDTWHTLDTPDVTGIYRLSDFITEELRRLGRAGETIIIRDTQTDPRTDRDRYAALQIRAFVTVPFHQNGAWKYVFTVNDAVARDWQADEIELIREVTNRTFPRLERARAEAALRKHEELMRLALTGAQAGSWEWDLRTGQFNWSEENFRLYGLNPADGSPSYDEWFENLVHPDDQERVQAYVERALARELPMINLEFRILHPQTGVRWLLGLGHLICNEQGQPLQINGINLDISDRKKAELTLQKQIQQEYLLANIAQDIRQSLDLQEVLSRTVDRVRELLNTDRVIIFRFAPDWSGQVTMESVGADFLSILSTTITDRCFNDRYVEPYRQGRIGTIGDVDRSDLEPCHVELLKTFQVKANLIVPILVKEALWGLLIAHHCTAPREWQATEIALLKRLSIQVSIAIQQAELYQNLQTELLERQQAEQKIREQAALLDISSDAIFVRDLAHRILYWNQGAERLYGWTAAEAIGQNAIELLQDNPTAVAEIFQTILTTGLWQGETRKFSRTGQELIVQGRWTLVRDEAGQPKFILTVNTDITDKKNLEAQFYHAQRLESLGTLASGIAHDLNNVLTPIVTLSQLLRLHQTDMDERSQHMLKLLEDSAKRGADIVKQILAFTRGTEGERQPVEVARVLQEVIDVVRQTFPKSISIDQATIDPNLWLVSVDPTYLHQILMNLCVNARDAMPDGGLLTLAVDNFQADRPFIQTHLQAHIGNYVMITVTDTGSGIAPEVRDRIFDPFFTTKDIGQGTGLGLSTVLGIIKTYDGFIEVQSQPGRGSQFQVYLPAMTIETTASETAVDLPLGQGELILMVDDELSILQSTQAILEAYNYRVITASEGVAAIELYRERQHEIHAVIMDMMMPNMSGITVIQILQALNPQVRIIGTSGLAGSYRQSLQNLGISTLLSKPFNTAELLHSIV